MLPVLLRPADTLVPRHMSCLRYLFLFAFEETQDPPFSSGRVSPFTPGHRFPSVHVKGHTHLLHKEAERLSHLLDLKALSRGAYAIFCAARPSIQPPLWLPVSDRLCRHKQVVAIAQQTLSTTSLYSTSCPTARRDATATAAASCCTLHHFCTVPLLCDVVLAERPNGDRQTERQTDTGGCSNEMLFPSIVRVLFVHGVPCRCGGSRSIVSLLAAGKQKESRCLCGCCMRPSL